MLVLLLSKLNRTVEEWRDLGVVVTKPSTEVVDRNQVVSGTESRMK